MHCSIFCKKQTRHKFSSHRTWTLCNPDQILTRPICGETFSELCTYKCLRTSAIWSNVKKKRLKWLIQAVSTKSDLTSCWGFFPWLQIYECNKILIVQILTRYLALISIRVLIKTLPFSLQPWGRSSHDFPKESKT